MRKRLAAVVVLSVVAAGWTYASELGQRRTADRQMRLSALKGLPDALKKANTPYVAALVGTCQWLVGLQAKTDVGTLLVELEALDEKNPALAGLKKSADEIAAPAILDEAKQKELATRLKTARKARATGLADIAATYYRCGLAGKAFDLLQQAMDADPDNAAARQAFGYVKVGAEWKDAFAAQQIQKGNAYVPEMGWVPAAAAERAKKGEWLENGKWMTIDEANALHSIAATPWIVEAQHFTLKSTAPRKQSVQFAENLDALRQACCREYLDFFLRERRPPQAQFVFALNKKMLALYFADKMDYDVAIKKEFKGPLAAYQIVLLMLPSFYTPLTHTSYFNQGIPEPLRSIFQRNQIASQILGEYAQVGTAGPKAWISSGVCGAIQYAAPDDKGRFVVPVGHAHQAVIKASEMLAQGNLPALSTLFTMSNDQFNSPLTPGNSDVAAALCRFLLETKDGACAMDLLDFVYDSLKGAKAANLSDYIGMDNATLEKEFEAYLKQ